MASRSVIRPAAKRPFVRVTWYGSDGATMTAEGHLIRVNACKLPKEHVQPCCHIAVGCGPVMSSGLYPMTWNLPWQHVISCEPI